MAAGGLVLCAPKVAELMFNCVDPDLLMSILYQAGFHLIEGNPACVYFPDKHNNAICITDKGVFQGTAASAIKAMTCSRKERNGTPSLLMYSQGTAVSHIHAHNGGAPFYKAASEMFNLPTKGLVGEEQRRQLEHALAWSLINNSGGAIPSTDLGVLAKRIEGVCGLDPILPMYISVDSSTTTKNVTVKVATQVWQPVANGSGGHVFQKQCQQQRVMTPLRMNAAADDEQGQAVPMVL